MFFFRKICRLLREMCSKFCMSYAVFGDCCLYSVGWSLCCVGPLGCIAASLVSLILMVSVSPISSLLLHSQPTVHITHKTFLTHTQTEISQTHAADTHTHTHPKLWPNVLIYNSYYCPNHSMLPSFHKMPIIECPRLRRFPAWSSCHSLLTLLLKWQLAFSH